MTEESALASRIRQGGDRRLRMLAAQGLVPLPVEDLVPIQVELADGEDEELAGVARQSLAAMDANFTARLIRDLGAGGVGPVLRYFARSSSNPLVVEEILRRRDLPHEVLFELAPRLPSTLQESLLLRQDAIVENPAILDALEENPQLSTFSQRRIQEYRDHLLQSAPRSPRPVPAPELMEEGEEAETKEVEAALAEVRESVAPEGEIDEVTGLSEHQIRILPVSVRLSLARGASRGLRSILIRDHHPRVAVAVLTHNLLADSEVEQIAASRVVAEEVLDAISKSREWMRKYPIVVALARNPKTPPGLAVRLLNRLSVRDLRVLARDRNIADVVRRNAQRFYTIKQQ